MERKKNRLNLTKTDFVLGALLLMVLLYEIINVSFTNNIVLNSLIDMTVTRMLAGVFFLIIGIKRGYKMVCFDGKTSVLSVLCVLPCLLVVLNNLPIISLFTGECRLSMPVTFVLPFALQCLAVGFFEEIAFRGVFFLLFLKDKRNTKGQVFKIIFLSSIIFGSYHLFNLFEGANPLGVLMQVGYSALIGAMCAMVFLKTKNIIIPVVLHAGFNFCGTLIPTLGEGEIWNTPTIIITVIIAVAVFLYMLGVFLKYDIKETDCFYKDLQIE